MGRSSTAWGSGGARYHWISCLLVCALATGPGDPHLCRHRPVERFLIDDHHRGSRGRACRGRGRPWLAVARRRRWAVWYRGLQRVAVRPPEAEVLCGGPRRLGACVDVSGVRRTSGIVRSGVVSVLDGGGPVGQPADPLFGGARAGGAAATRRRRDDRLSLLVITRTLQSLSDRVDALASLCHQKGTSTAWQRLALLFRGRPLHGPRVMLRSVMLCPSWLLRRCLRLPRRPACLLVLSRGPLLHLAAR